MSNSDIKQSGTVNGRISNGLNLSGRILIGSGSSDFIINMTVTTTDGETFTVTSCDATREQIDAAVAADKRVVLRVSVGDIRYELPMVYSYQGYVYLFTAFLGSLIYAVIEPVGENENEWSFVTTQIEADAITYSNSSLSNVSDVKGALNELVSDSHTHLNKSVLDKFAESDGKPTYNGEPIGGGPVGDITAENVTYTYPNTDWVNAKDAFDGIIASFNVLAGQIDGPIQSAHTHDNKSVIDKLSVAGDKLQYNGSDVGLKGDKGDKGDAGAAGADGHTPVKGTDYWTAADKAEMVDELKPSQVTSGTSITLADNTEYRLTDVTELSITYPDGNFECWMRLAFAADGTITVTLPSTTQYIGTTPTFANGETWELSIKDCIVIAGKVA